MNDGRDFVGQYFEFASGEVFLAQLNVVHTATGSLGNNFEQTAAARRFIPGELGAIGNVVEKQEFSRRSSTVSRRSLIMLTEDRRQMTGYGFVLAISGTASPVRFGCWGER